MEKKKSQNFFEVNLYDQLMEPEKTRITFKLIHKFLSKRVVSCPETPPVYYQNNSWELVLF